MDREHTGPIPRGARAVQIRGDGVVLHGDLSIPEHAIGVVVFAHGSGSGRKSPRNQHVARTLNRRDLATLLLDLLSIDEERVDAYTAHLRFDIGLLAERLVAATDFVAAEPSTERLPIGFFGASTGAAAALVAASRRADRIAAVVSRGGRPDLAGPALARVRAPTLLIVGGDDVPVIEMNEEALAKLEHVQARLEIVEGATHLFEEPGTLDQVARLAGDWFGEWLPRGPGATSPTEPSRPTARPH